MIMRRLLPVQHKALLTTSLGFLLVALTIGLAIWSQTGSTFAATPAAPARLIPTSCEPNWTMVNTSNPRTHHYLNAIEVISANDVWAVGEYYSDQVYTYDTALTMHWDGNTWTIVPTPPQGLRIRLMGVSAVASNDVWAVGLYYPGGAYEPIAMHWDGTAWTIVPTPNIAGGTELRDVVAIASNDVWAVGANDGAHRTITMHWDGNSWTIVPSPNTGTQDNILTSVDALAPNDVWAVGYVQPDGGSPTTISMRWNGSQWTMLSTPNPGNYARSLHGITALSSNDIWAVGQYSYNSGETYLPLFLHWTGTQWTHVTGPEFPDYSVLRAVTAVSANDIWAVGTNAVSNFAPFDTLIMHWDGNAWSRVYSPNGFRTFSRLYGVAAVSSDEVWAVGYSDNSGYPYNSDSLVLRHLCPSQGTPTATVSATATRTATAMPTSTTTATALPTNTATVIQPSATSAPSNTAIATSTSTSVSTPPATVTQVATITMTRTSTSTAVPPSSTPVAASATATATTPPVTATATTCTMTFRDVPQGHTFYSSVYCLACRGIISGYADGTFKPDNLVTRGQLAKIVSNAANFTEAPGTQIFQDVAPDHTFYEWINRLTNRGYMSGYSCGGPGEPCVNNRPYFRPFANATRAQTSKIVANAARYNDPPAGQTFEDVPPTHPFYVEIQRLASRNIMGGYNCGGLGEPCIQPLNRPYFRPYNDVTRGQSAKIVSNTFYPECQTP